MNQIASIQALCIAFGTATLIFGLAPVRAAESRNHNGSASTARSPRPALPPLPAGVTDLKFSDFFMTPVGPCGLELTDKLQRLDNARVRILGYMVRQEASPIGKFLFSALPVQMQDHDSALADDLPPATVYVSVPTCVGKPVPFAPGLMLLTGTLSVCANNEEDGRVSIVRLALDPPSKSPRQHVTGNNAKGAERLLTSKPAVRAR